MSQCTSSTTIVKELKLFQYRGIANANVEVEETISHAIN
jgi:hypothetical protein